LTLTGSATGVSYTLTGSGGTDIVAVSADASYSLTSNALTVTATGFSATAVTLNTIETANLTGGTSANTFTVTGWAGTANLDGAGGNDAYNITLIGSGSGIVNVSDTAGTADTVTVTGTSNADSISISAAAVTLGTEVVNYSGAESLGVDGAL